jgi:type II secretory pathway component PulF
VPIALHQERRSTALAAGRRRAEEVAVLARARGTAPHATGRPGERELVFFATRLALLLEMGTSLNRALAAIAAQLRDRRMANIVRLVQADVEAGMPLSAALGRHPVAFDAIFASMVRAGESAGILPAMLARQAELLERRRRFRAAVRGSLTYPAFLVLLSTVVVAFMLGFVYPRFAGLLHDVRGTLPWTTRLLLACGIQLRQHAVWIAGAAIGLLLALQAAARTVPGRRLLLQVQLRAPGLGAVLRQMYAARLLLNLGTLLASRVPLLDAVAIVEGLLPQPLYGTFLADLRRSTEEGRGLAAAFATSRLFPPTVQEMIQTGESSAALDRIMLRLAEFYEEEMQERVRGFLQILEPVLLVGMGIVVAGIALSLLLPILKLSGGVR